MKGKPLLDRLNSPPPLVGGGWGEGGKIFSPLPPDPPPQGAANFRVFRRLSLICAFLLIILIASTNLSAAQIQDDLGQPVSLQAPPQRIVSLYGGLTEILIALGVKDRIVAHIQGDESLTDIPTVGTHLQPNVEMILALKPDLVVQGGVSKGMPALKKLEAEGVPVAMFAPHDFAGLFSTIQRLGALTGQEAAAAALNQSARPPEKIAARLAGTETGPGLLRGALSEPAGRRAGLHGERHHYPGRRRQCGGDRQKLTPFSLEALLQAKPDVYLIQQGPMNRSPEDIYSRPYFQELRAVQAKRVLVVDEGLFSHPGPRSAEAVEQLARFLHPDAWQKQ